MYYKHSLNNRIINGDDDDESKAQVQIIQKKQPYKSFEQTYTAQQIHFYISDEIIEPEYYVEMIHKILTAGPNDVIFIHLNTPGGNLITGIQIINAMQNSQGKIITVLESTAYSLGTLIFLAGDEMVVHDHCMMMFHNFKSGIFGKGHEQIAELEATVKWFSNMAKKIYIPFLSEEEFDRILRGEDIWMHSPEIRKRLDRMIREIQEPKPKRGPKKQKVVDEE